jgi:CheY-like chemotaxis protein
VPKILGVDDSQTMRRILEMTFAGDGNSSIATVSDGDSAVRWATENAADVVLADASMKGTDGYEVARALRTNPATQHVAVIVLASQHHPYDAEKGRSAGVDDHMLKPFETQAMLDKVRDVLGRPRVPAAGAAARPAAAPMATSTPGSTVAARPVAPPSPPRPAPAAPVAPPAPVAAPARPAATPQRGATIGFGAPPVARPATAAPPAASLSAFPTPAARTSAPSTAPNPASGMLPLIAGAVAAQPAAVPQPSRADAPSMAGALPAQKPALELDGEPFAEVTPATPTAAVTAAANATASNGEMANRLSGMGLSPQQIDGVLALSREVIERVVWEVVPDLAETIIREEIRRLTSQ